MQSQDAQNSRCAPPWQSPKKKTGNEAKCASCVWMPACNVSYLLPSHWCRNWAKGPDGWRARVQGKKKKLTWKFIIQKSVCRSRRGRVGKQPRWVKNGGCSRHLSTGRLSLPVVFRGIANYLLLKEGRRGTVRLMLMPSSIWGRRKSWRYLHTLEEPKGERRK